MLHGCTGRILFVDLTHRITHEEEISELIYRDFIGGNGLGIRIMYERIKPGVDPLGSDNILGFTTGILTANPVPGSGRYIVVTKSPLTCSWSESNGGGAIGPEIKTAGYDAIFFSGVSPKPVYLFVNNGKPELRDATKVWGKDTYETEDILH